MDEAVRKQPPQRYTQPLMLAQTQAEIASQRAGWGRRGGEADHSDYLVVAGERVNVPFATRVFDREPALCLDGSLPWRTWCVRFGQHLRATTLSLIAAPKAAWLSRRQTAARLREPARWRSLGQLGHFSTCAKPRDAIAGLERPGVRAVVLHWDMCNSSAQCFDVLRQRGLSAHLLVDEDGLVFQLLDLSTMTAFHAGPLNETSVGIEINNPIDPRLHAATAATRALVQEAVPHTREHGYRLDFTPAQKRVVAQLVDFLCAQFQIPERLPASIDADGNEPAPSLVAADFAGVCGHYHVGTHKADPGLSLWPFLREHWGALKS